MVGVIGGLIILVVLIILGIAVASFLGSAITDLTTAGQDLLDAFNLRLQPKAGEQVCDVEINTFANLEERLFSSPVIKFEPNVRSWRWFNCHDATQVPFASLVELRGLEDQLALISTGETVESFVRLKDFATGQEVTSNKRLHEVGAGIVETPISFDARFVITNIPSRDYELLIFYQHPTIKIEGKAINEPFIDKICAVGKSSC